jgi:hypothetical protein
MNRGSGARVFGAVLLALVVLGVAAWVFRDDLLRRFTSEPQYTEVSPEAAASAEAKLRRLRENGDTVRLTDVEIASLLHYQVGTQFPGLVENPTASFHGDTMRLGGRVPTRHLPDLQDFERLRPFLPDTTRIDLEARLSTSEPGRAMIEIDAVSVAGVPVPERYYPSVLNGIGRQDEPGLPGNAIAVRLPEGIGTARVSGGHLVLTP